MLQACLHWYCVYYIIYFYDKLSFLTPSRSEFFLCFAPNIIAEADPVISWRHFLGVVFTIFWRRCSSFVNHYYFHIIWFLALGCEALLELDWFLCGPVWGPFLAYLFPASNSFLFSGNNIKIEVYEESDMKKRW